AFNAYATSDNCSDLPQGIVAPDPSNTACLTAFTDVSSTPNLIQYLPTSCGGGGGQQADLTIGTPITLTNGAKVPHFMAFQDCFNQGFTDWVVPVVACNTNCNQSTPITAWAEIRLTAVNVHGSTSTVTFNSICKIDPAATGSGGTDRGVKSIAMVE